jgi:alkanesulfonate monooxygenase SsuD/methylene tetrahydromethanopterin reductase-like flavin-dependent oxidoreductase (luciferase family)
MTRPVAFGLNVGPNPGGLAIAARIAAIADTAGLEYAGVRDHPYNPDFADTMTHITWLAAHTGRVHLFPNVADLPLIPAARRRRLDRPPVLTGAAVPRRPARPGRRQPLETA